MKFLMVMAILPKFVDPNSTGVLEGLLKTHEVDLLVELGILVPIIFLEFGLLPISYFPKTVVSDQ